MSINIDNKTKLGLIVVLVLIVLFSFLIYFDKELVAQLLSAIVRIVSALR